MTKKTVSVVVDIIEPGRVREEFENHPEVEEVRVAPLQAADIVIGGIGFERKGKGLNANSGWNDYVGSMMDGRLDDQPSKMSEAFDAAYILVGGDLDGTEQYWSEMKPESVRGHMASLTARDGSGVRAVLPCGNLALLVDMAVRLARKHQEEPSSPQLPSGDVGDDEPAAKQMYGCIPGVGREGAETLYEHYPAPGDVFTASVEDIEELPGFGEKRAESVKEVFNR